MDKPDLRLLVCASFRTQGEPKGVCHKKGAVDLRGYLESEVNDRGLAAKISSTGCLNVCDRGPVMVVYPSGQWVGKVDEEKIDAVLDALEEGEDVPAELEMA